MQRCFLVSILLSAASFSETITQTDWSGGDGAPGPVTEWGDCYDFSSQMDSTGGVLQIDATIPLKHSVSNSFDGASSVYSVDIDGDGDMDILGAASNDRDIIWWENDNGSGTVWIEHLIDGSVLDAATVFSADIDGDGDMDVLGADYRKDVIWWENVNGSGSVWIKHIIDNNFGNSTSIFSTDIDGDGDNDVLGSAMDLGHVAWWENTDGSGFEWSKHIVDTSFYAAIEVCAADINSDGYMDVLGASTDMQHIWWWENIDGSGIEWIGHPVDCGYYYAYSVYSADIDGDGDIDILGSNVHNYEINWWENINSDGIQWSRHNIETDIGYGSPVYSADMNSDGYVDVLGSTGFGHGITWWENENGSGDTWVTHIVDSNFAGGNSVYAADIDGDGNMDILGSSSLVDEICWWEVLDGYFGEGVLESSILDAGEVSSWNTFLSNSQIPAGTSVGFQFRSSVDSGDMGTWSDTVFSPELSLSDILVDSTRYLQYKVILETSDPAKTPVLEDVSFNFYYTGINTDDVSLWSLCFSENPSCSHLLAIFSVPEAGTVDLLLYDVSGRVIAEVSQESPTGTHSAIFGDLAEGVYFCTMRAGDFSATEKVVVLE